MWIDSVTVAVHRLDVLDPVWNRLGVQRHTRESDVLGAERAWVSLGTVCLELIAASERTRLRQFTWGRALLRFLAVGEGIFRLVVGVPDVDQFICQRRALGVRFWPPIDETWARCESGLRTVRVSQMDPLFPWVVAYDRCEKSLVTNTVSSITVEVDSVDPATLAFQYQTALGQPAIQSPTGTAAIALENGAITFVHSDYTGYGGLILRHGDHRAMVRVQSHTRSLQIE